MLVATEEELRLLELMTPDYWDPQAVKRGLRGVKLASAELTESGVVGTLTLDGRDTLKELKAGVRQHIRERRARG